MEVKINMSKETLFDLLLITEQRIDNYANRIDSLVKRGAISVANRATLQSLKLRTLLNYLKSI